MGGRRSPLQYVQYQLYRGGWYKAKLTGVFFVSALLLLPLWVRNSQPEVDPLSKAIQAIPGKSRSPLTKLPLAFPNDQLVVPSYEQMVAQNTRKFDKVPGLVDLTFYLWETDPKPIIMLSNSHLTWYTEAETEKHMIALMRRIYTTATPGGGIVIDMGINDGYIAALAASYDLPVIAVDAQPECVRRFRIAALFNDWGSRVRIYNNIMADEEMSLDIPNGRCTGGSRFLNGVQMLGTKGVETDMQGVTTVKSARLDDLVGEEEVLMFHLDVEGAELSVLRSAKRMLAEKRLQNLVFEFAPHRWIKTAEESLAEVKTVFGGMHCRQLAHATQDLASWPVITDWDKIYHEWAAALKIEDIWCSQQKH